MEQEILFKGRINFQDVIEIYRQIISVGFKPFNIYSLSAYNYDLGIHLMSNFHYDENDFIVTKSNNVKEKNLVKRLEKSVLKLEQDIEDSLSKDLLVSNSPKVRYHQETGKWDIENIADIEAQKMIAYKLPEDVPLIGARINVQLPFMINREIKFEKTDGIYQVKLLADSRTDLDEVEKVFYKLVSPSTE